MQTLHNRVRACLLRLLNVQEMRETGSRSEFIALFRRLQARELQAGPLGALTPSGKLIAWRTLPSRPRVSGAIQMRESSRLVFALSHLLNEAPRVCVCTGLSHCFDDGDRAVAARHHVSLLESGRSMTVEHAIGHAAWLRESPDGQASSSPLLQFQWRRLFSVCSLRHLSIFRSHYRSIGRRS